MRCALAESAELPDEEVLEYRLQTAVDVSSRQPISIDRLLENAIEAEAIAGGILDGEIQLMIHTPQGRASKADGSYIRKAAIASKLPHIATVAAAAAAAKGIATCAEGRSEIRSLRSYHASIR